MRATSEKYRLNSYDGEELPFENYMKLDNTNPAPDEVAKMIKALFSIEEYRDGYIYSEDDIRYALPEHLFDIGKVERAIELAKDDLVNKYGLPDPDIFIFGDSEIVAEDCVRQITLFELLSEELPKAA